MAFLVEFPTLHGETLGKSLGVNMGPMIIHPLRRGDNRLGLGVFLPFITLVGWTFEVTVRRQSGLQKPGCNAGVVFWWGGKVGRSEV